MLSASNNIYIKLNTYLNMIKTILEDFGLNERESKIYLQLLKEKISSAAYLAKLTGINRTTVYLELENLIKLGLVSYIVKNSKKHFMAAPPEKLLEILEIKKARIKKHLPQLKSLHKTTEKFKIETYEGKEGIKTFYQEVTNQKEEVLVLGGTGRALEILEFEYPHFMKKFVKLKLKQRMIANKDSRKRIKKFHPKSNFKIKYFPEKYKDNVTTVIYSDKVAIQSLQKDNIYVIIITDPLLSETYKNHFEIIWKIIK